MIFYIDPGTGSMLFSIVIGLATALYFVGKATVIKLKQFFSGGKAIVSKNHVPLVIYSEGNQYWYVFKPILDALEKRSISTIFYTSSEDDPVFEQDYVHIKSENIGQGNKAFARLNFLEADVCLMTTPSLDVLQLKRSKGVKHYSHIVHMVSDTTTYRLFGLDYFDSVLLSGEYQKKHIRVLEAQRSLPQKELVVVGCTYLDVLAERKKSLNIDEQKAFTVLVAPSWGASSLLSRYGTKLLDPLIASGLHVIIRPHPQSRQVEAHILDELQERYKNLDNIEWDYEAENLRSLARADIMISDFSGVMFDYAFLFNRPFLYVNHDFDARPYDMYDIEDEPWQFKAVKKMGIELKSEQFSSIAEVLKEAQAGSDLQHNRELEKAYAWQHQGESGERVADFIVAKLRMKLDP